VRCAIDSPSNTMAARGDMSSPPPDDRGLGFKWTMTGPPFPLNLNASLDGKIRNTSHVTRHTSHVTLLRASNAQQHAHPTSLKVT
jgi:hypothetical protein